MNNPPNGPIEVFKMHDGQIKFRFISDDYPQNAVAWGNAHRIVYELNEHNYPFFIAKYDDEAIKAIAASGLSQEQIRGFSAAELAAIDAVKNAKTPDIRVKSGCLVGLVAAVAGIFRGRGGFPEHGEMYKE